MEWTEVHLIQSQSEVTVQITMTNMYGNTDRTSVKLMTHLRKFEHNKVNKLEKWQKLTAGLNPNHKHIYKPWKKKR